MKIAQMSDLHYAAETLQEVDRCFGFAVEDAIARKVDVAIITGDSTDHRMDAHAPALLALAHRIKQLADHCPVLMLQGTFSHEPLGLLRMFELIGAKHPITVSDRIERIGLRDGAWRRLPMFDPHFDPIGMQLVVTSLPTVNRADLVTALGADKASAQGMGDTLFEIMQGFAPGNAFAAASGIPTVAISHGTVHGCMTEHGVPMAGLDHEFTTAALFSMRTVASMIGHIHAHQSWQNDHDGMHQVIAYPGSIGRLHYGEQGDKNYLVWNVTAKSASFEAVPTPAKRMVDVFFDGPPDMEVIKARAPECANAFVRVRYCVDEEYAASVDREAIRQALGSATQIKIEAKVLPVQRQRCAGITTLSLEDRLTKWGEQTNTSVTGLLERLPMLHNQEPEVIAQRSIEASA